MPPKARPKSKPRTSTPKPVAGEASSKHVGGGARASGSGSSGAEETLLANAHGDTEMERRREERAGRGSVERSNAQSGQAWSVSSELSSLESQGHHNEPAEKGEGEVEAGGSAARKADDKGKGKAEESERVSSDEEHGEGQQDQDGLQGGDDDGDDKEEEEHQGGEESGGEDNEQQDGVGSEQEAQEAQEAQGGAHGGHATTRSGRVIIVPSREGFVDHNQRHQSSQAGQGCARQDGNRRTEPRAPARRVNQQAPAPTPGRRGAENNKDVADMVGGILDSTIDWLDKGGGIARALRRNRSALVNALKRPGSGGGGGAAPGGKRSKK
jgi:hypothetical protein